MIENSPKKATAGTEDPLGDLEAELKVLEFKDFPKVQLKGNYKNKARSTRYKNSQLDSGPILIQSWAADEADEQGNL